jgi:uncharacterized membrane protein YccC
MSEAVAERRGPGAGNVFTRLGAALAGGVSAGGSPLLFGFRLWASVCLALFVAFYLQLENASWAGTSAAIVCQPQLGASLRKGWFRLIGTLVGAVWIVVLTACFPQDRIAFLGILALWCALWAYFATQLRNFASYAAALAGYTAVIIASDTLGATGGSDGQVFMVAVTRASEISIGIISAGIVLAGTDLGRAPRQLASAIGGLAADISGRFVAMLSRAGTDVPDTQSQRRELVRRAIALDPMVDQAIGESSELRYHSPVLQSAVYGLFTAVDGWRTVAVRLASMPTGTARRQAFDVLSALPVELRSLPEPEATARWLQDPVGLRNTCRQAMQALLRLPASTPSLRLLADQTAKVLAGISSALDGVALLIGAPAQPSRAKSTFQLSVPDSLPALVNALRAFLTVGAVALFWVVTAWPSGPTAMLFVAIVVLLLAPRGDMALPSAIAFAAGTGIAIPFAAIIKFAVLPNFETYLAFCLALGVYLVPVGIGMAQTWAPRVAFVFTAMAFNFVPILSPENEISYNTVEFYNSALAIFAGCAVAALSFYLLPPLSPELRTRRLLAFALRDLRRSAIAGPAPALHDWEQRMYGRVAAMPDRAEPLQRSQLIAVLTVGNQVLQLRAIAHLLPIDVGLEAALAAVADGDSEMAIVRFGDLDRHLAAAFDTVSEAHPALQARASILAITEAIAQHAAFFDAGARK